MKAKKVLDLLKETATDGIDDEIGKFWVVTAPTENSVLEDILFEANVGYMMNQCRGGLDPGDVLGIFKKENKSKAEAMANRILKGE
jgi:hypothetical protein